MHAPRRTGVMTYDPVADAGYLKICGGRIVDTDFVLPGIIVDFGEDGTAVGIEWLFGLMEPGPAPKNLPPSPPTCRPPPPPGPLGPGHLLPHGGLRRPAGALPPSARPWPFCRPWPPPPAGTG